MLFPTNTFIIFTIEDIVGRNSSHFHTIYLFDAGETIADKIELRVAVQPRFDQYSVTTFQIVNVETDITEMVRCLADNLRSVDGVFSIIETDFRRCFVAVGSIDKGVGMGGVNGIDLLRQQLRIQA